MVTIRQGDKRQNEKIISYITNSSNSLSYLKSLPKSLPKKSLRKLNRIQKEYIY